MSKKKTVPGEGKPRRRGFGRMDVNALMKANGAKKVGLRTEFYEIPLTEITVDSLVQTRAPFDPKGDRDDGAFLASMREYGQRKPVVLFELASGKYEVLAGHRRIAALRYLGKKIVLAELVSANEYDRTTDAVIENVYRPTNPSEKVGIVKIFEGQGRTNLEIAKAMGIEKRYVRKLKAISIADEAVQLALSKGQIDVMTALLLAQAPSSDQPRLTKLVVENRMNEADTRELVKHVKTADKAPDEAAAELGLVFPATEIVGEPTQEKKSAARDDKGSEGTKRPAPQRSERPEPRITVSSGPIARRLRMMFPDYAAAGRLQAVAGAASRKSASWKSALLAGLLVVGEEEPFLPTRKPFEMGPEAIEMANTIKDVHISNMVLAVTRIRGEILVYIKNDGGEVPEPTRMLFLALGKLFTQMGERK